MAYLKDQLLTYGYAVSPSNATRGVGRERALSVNSSESNTDATIACSMGCTHITTPSASGSNPALAKLSTPIFNVNMEPLVLMKVLPSPSSTPTVSRKIGNLPSPRHASAVAARRGLVVSASNHSQSNTVLPSPFRDLKEDDSNDGSGSVNGACSLDSLSHIPTSAMSTPDFSVILFDSH